MRRPVEPAQEASRRGNTSLLELGLLGKVPKHPWRGDNSTRGCVEPKSAGNFGLGVKNSVGWRCGNMADKNGQKWGSKCTKSLTYNHVVEISGKFLELS